MCEIFSFGYLKINRNISVYFSGVNAQDVISGQYHNYIMLNLVRHYQCLFPECLLPYYVSTMIIYIFSFSAPLLGFVIVTILSIVINMNISLWFSFSFSFCLMMLKIHLCVCLYPEMYFFNVLVHL